MTILRFNWIALILIYIGAITLGFLYDTMLGWGITLYSLGSIIYYFIILNITKSKNEKSIKNS
jgi:predicted membrane channel-forming protein YqfA (hemolysin III family)